MENLPWITHRVPETSTRRHSPPANVPDGFGEGNACLALAGLGSNSNARSSGCFFSSGEGLSFGTLTFCTGACNAQPLPFQIAPWLAETSFVWVVPPNLVGGDEAHLARGLHLELGQDLQRH